MKITKFGHSCLLIEEDGVRMLIDPGSYSTIPENLENIDVILVTHEHSDHYTPEVLKKLLDTNKDAQVITNSGVGAQLEKAGIAYQVIEDGQGIKIGTVRIEAEGHEHAYLYTTISPCHNTGYFIAGKLFCPGDSFYTVPTRPVEILALPVVAPWCTIGDAVDYAIKVKPKKCFPIHNGNIKDFGIAHKLPAEVLAKADIEFIILENGKEYSF